MDRFGCLGSTIKTPTGYFDFDNPTLESVDLVSIALSLSKICRYGGRCTRFYSVAEHCVLAYEMAHNDGVGDDCLRAILMHDAAEAYVGDLVKPIKVRLPEYCAIEDRVSRLIGERFGIDFAGFEQTIKVYDRTMLRVEKLFMWPDDENNWEGFDSLDVSGVKLFCWDCDVACSEFIRCANAVGLF